MPIGDARNIRSARPESRQTTGRHPFDRDGTSRYHRTRRAHPGWAL